MKIKSALGNIPIAKVDSSGNSVAFFCKAGVVSAKKSWNSALVKLAKKMSWNIARICLHSSSKDSLQQMIVYLRKGYLHAPHRHRDREESYTVLSGKAILYLFSSTGKVKEKITLSSDGVSIARVPKNTFHALVATSLSFVFLETRAGPFRKSSTDYLK